MSQERQQKAHGHFNMAYSGAVDEGTPADVTMTVTGSQDDRRDAANGGKVARQSFLTTIIS